MKHMSLVIAALSFRAAESLACGGLFCDQTNVVVPPAQSSERIIFVIRDRPDDPGEPGLWNPDAGTDAGASQAGMDGGSGDAGADAGAGDAGADAGRVDAGAPFSTTVDTYVEIAYSGAAESFAWVVPLLAPPLSIDTAPVSLFDDLDAATAPRFTFVYQGEAFAASEESSTDCACEPIGAAGSGGDDVAEAPADPEVTVLGTERVGPYEVAVIRSTQATALRNWLLANGYQIPASAEALMAAYVAEGKVFAAFRLADGKGVGAIQPVMIRQPGVEPCIPLRLTPVASEPVLSVTALVIGGGRALSTNYQPIEVDPESVRPTSPTTSDYSLRLRAAARDRGGRAFATEFAGWSSDLEVTTDEARQLLGQGDFVTRLSTRMAPGEMTADPIFVHTDTTDPVSRDHVVDVTDDAAALDTLGVYPAIEASAAASGLGTSSCATAGRVRKTSLPFAALLAAVALVLRRRQS